MAEPIVAVVDAKGMPLPPVDPNVKLPPSVMRSSAQADALHQQAYNTQPQPQPEPVPQPAPAPQPEPTPRPAPAAADAERASWDAAKWMQHAKSMEGRYRQTQEQVTTLQGSLSELGEELLRTQAAPRPQQQLPQNLSPPPPLLTQQDVDTYGNDLLDVAQRAALQAVAPKLTALEQQNVQLQRQLRKQTIQSIETVLDAAIPNWPQINLSARFKAWLRLRDVYSGRVRNELLNEAHRAADAARVLTFFKGFLAEEEATGSTEFTQDQSQPSPSLATPPAPALELQTLAAPGHARPPQGSTPNAPADGPIWITRGQISAFYTNVRKGVYVGREQDYLNDQAIIFDCQKNGRIR